MVIRPWNKLAQRRKKVHFLEINPFLPDNLMHTYVNVTCPLLPTLSRGISYCFNVVYAFCHRIALKHFYYLIFALKYTTATIIHINWSNIKMSESRDKMKLNLKKRGWIFYSGIIAWQLSSNWLSTKSNFDAPVFLQINLNSWAFTFLLLFSTSYGYLNKT